LKTFQDKKYRVLGAVLSKILEGIALVHELGFWLEIVTLVVPGFNDSDEELRQIAKFFSLDLSRYSLARDGVSQRL
jgi:pyruvate formate lyase activating enzyme